MCHNKHFCKLRSLGIEGDLLSWIISFLSNRTIRTLVGSALSNSCPLRSGVVQGSCISPLLFVLYVNVIYCIVLYVNDVEKMFSNCTTTKLFADDLCQLVATPSYRKNLIYSALGVSNGSSLFRLIKCSIFYVGNLSKMHQKDVFINAVCSPLVNTVKDLGILIDSQLKLDLHINSIVAKAYARACVIFR